jgi:hypothetical protein
MGKILCRLPVHDKGFFKIMIFHFFQGVDGKNTLPCNFFGRAIFLCRAP